MADVYALSFEAFALTPSPTKRTLVSARSCRYSVSDVSIVQRTARDGSVFWEKTLPLSDSGFGLGVFLEEKPIREHLGLFITGPAAHDSFSWENFVAEGGNVFSDDRGGRVEAVFDPGPGPDHLTGLAFLSDATLRYREDVMADGFSHEVVVKRGSVFRVR